MATFDKQPGLEAAQPHTHLDVNEKSAVIASDVSSSQVSHSHDYEGDLPDPDAGKSDEERAVLVRLMHSLPCHYCVLTPHRTKRSCGKSTCG
jgi:hypothetical protein